MFPIEYLKLTDENKKQLLKDALIYFDASALLDLYDFSDKAIRDIFEKLIQSKDRHFVTEHNWFEYNKNKDVVLLKPISLYKKLIGEVETESKSSRNDGAHFQKILVHLTSLRDDHFKLIKEQSKQIVNKTSKNNKHPFLTQDISEKFSDQIESSESRFVELINKFLEEYKFLQEELEKEIAGNIELVKSRQQKDIVADEINKYFTITNVNFAFKDIMKIVQEGELRYKFKIPPGYGDYIDDEKEGIQAFGDLISWKQLLNHAKTFDLPAIYITNDKKDMIDKKENSPKIELIKEYYDWTGNRFWLFKLTDFLHLLDEYSTNKLQDETKNEINLIQKEMDMHLRRSEKIIEEFTLQRINELHFTKALKVFLKSSYIIEGDPISDLTFRSSKYISFGFNAVDEDFTIGSETTLILAKVNDKSVMMNYATVLYNKFLEDNNLFQKFIDIYICYTSFEDYPKNSGNFYDTWVSIISSINRVRIHLLFYDENTHKVVSIIKIT